MTEFILDMTIVVSLFGMIFLIAKTVPEIDDTRLQVKEASESSFVSFLEEVDERVRVNIEKLLRKVRIYVWKVDNKVSDKIDSYKKEVDDKEDSWFEDSEEGK